MSRFSVADLQYTVRDTRIAGPVTIAAASDDRVFLKGPSGSGKSTICRVLAGRLPASFATETSVPVNPYYVGSVSYKSLSDFATCYIGSEPQAQLMAFKVADLFTNTSKKRAIHYLKKMGLSSDFLDREPVTLSTGEATRVLLAKTLASSDTIAVLDAPWGWIDPSSREDIANLLYNGLKGRIVIESDSAFAVQSSSLNHHCVELNGNNSPLELLKHINEFLDQTDEIVEKEIGNVKIEGFTQLTNNESKFRIEADELIFRLGKLHWAQGKNGSGKTTFARSVAMLPSRATGFKSSYTIETQNGSALNAQQAVGYVSSRSPVAEPGLKNAVRLLTSSSELRKRFSVGCNHLLDPMQPDSWAASSILSIMGATLYQLALGRKVILIDEPFFGSTSQEAHLGTAILRKWTQMFSAAIIVISHLAEPPRLTEEPLIRFRRDDWVSKVYL